MKRMTESFAQFLSSAVDDINQEIELLNHGGCGIFAVQFARLLQELGYENVVIVGMQTNADEIDRSFHKHNLEMLRDARANNYKPCDVRAYNHYMVKVGNWFFDSENAAKKTEKWLDIYVYDDKVRYYPVGDHSVEDMEFANKFAFLWNNEYNRRQNKKVESFFNNLKKELCSTH